MGNTKTLKPFTKNNQPANRGRKKGALNRSTAIKIWLDCMIKSEALDGSIQKMTVMETLILAQVKKAAAGDTAAFQVLMDSAFGKIPAVVQNEITSIQEHQTIIQIVPYEADSNQAAN